MTSISPMQKNVEEVTVGIFVEVSGLVYCNMT